VLNVIEFALLGLLKERPMHGYDLRKRLRDDFGPLANLSFGSLYPALGRLERAGDIQALSGELDRGTELPLTGSLGGERAATVARRATAKAAAALGGRGTRARKVYELTPHGEELFRQLLEAPPSGDTDARGFSVRLAFARHLTPPARVRLLERRRLELNDRLHLAEATLARPGHPLDAYERAIAEHARDAVVSDLAWIERLLESEQRGLIEGTSPTEGALTGARLGINPDPTGPDPAQRPRN
jgi:DNA-binding PadR family transcriptional regulator